MDYYDRMNIKLNETRLEVKQDNANVFEQQTTNLFISDQHITNDQFNTSFGLGYMNSISPNIWVYSNL